MFQSNVSSSDSLAPGDGSTKLFASAKVKNAIGRIGIFADLNLGILLYCHQDVIVILVHLKFLRV